MSSLIAISTSTCLSSSCRSVRLCQLVAYIHTECAKSTRRISSHKEASITCARKLALPPVLNLRSLAEDHTTENCVLTSDASVCGACHGRPRTINRAVQYFDHQSWPWQCFYLNDQMEWVPRYWKHIWHKSYHIRTISLALYSLKIVALHPTSCSLALERRNSSAHRTHSTSNTCLHMGCTRAQTMPFCSMHPSQRSENRLVPTACSAW